MALEIMGISIVWTAYHYAEEKYKRKIMSLLKDPERKQNICRSLLISMASASLKSAVAMDA